MQLLPEHLEGLFETPGESDSKYSRGIVGLITGTDEYPGAGVLSVSAAASCGAGYVRYNGPASSVQALLVNHPEVVFSADNHNHVDAWVVGSGFSGIYDNGEARAEEIRHIFTSSTDSAIVIDAGALETFATDKLTDNQRARCILTPHTGEALRLCEILGHDISREYIENNRETTALWLAHQLHCTIVLKGSRTVVANYYDELYTCPQATHWLATAGTGDILAGVMGAVVALNADNIRNNRVSIPRVAAAAVCVHSLAAGISAQDCTSMHTWVGSGGKDCSCKDIIDFDMGHQFALLDCVKNIPNAMVRLRNIRHMMASAGKDNTRAAI